MKKSFDAEGRQFAWDSTSIELAQTCLRKYYYRMIENWTPRESSVHLIFGGHYARALETFYKKRATGSSFAEALHEIIRETMIATWDYEKNEPQQFDHSAKTRMTLIRSIIWYLDNFEDEAMVTYHLADGTPAVELSFTIEIDDELLLCGHLDRVVEFQDHLYIMDQKTTGSTISSTFFEQFSPHNQMSLYTLAGKAVLHSPIRGVIIDGAQIAVGFTRFERGFVYRTPDQLEEWLAGARYSIAQARYAAESGFFPMNLSACGNYGGCPYRRVCSKSPGVRQAYLEGDFYHDKPWDPLVPR
jgi:hypothetical protein